MREQQIIRSYDLDSRSEFERHILGAVLVEPNSYIELSRVLNFRNFVRLDHMRIWRAFADLWKTKTTIELVSVNHRLRTHYDCPHLHELLVHCTQSVNSAVAARGWAFKLLELDIATKLLKAIGYITFADGQLTIQSATQEVVSHITDPATDLLKVIESGADYLAEIDGEHPVTKVLFKCNEDIKSKALKIKNHEL